MGEKERGGEKKIRRRKLTWATNHQRQVPKRAVVISLKVNPCCFGIGGRDGWVCGGRGWRLAAPKAGIKSERGRVTREREQGGGRDWWKEKQGQ